MPKDTPAEIDIIIFGAGIAGLWTFNKLKSMGYDALLLESDTIGCGQTIASQGIIHSGMKFTLAGKVNKLARTISAMPDIWRAALRGEGDVDLSAAKSADVPQHLLIPAGFMGGLTKLVAERALGGNVHAIEKNNWPNELKNSGFKGSLIKMNEPVLNIPSVLRALAAPYEDCIRKISDQQAQKPFDTLKEINIKAKRIIFTSAASNHIIAKESADDMGLETQKRPLVQAMLKNAPFPLFAHLVGKTDKPVASVTTHYMQDGTLIWYLGGLVAERNTDTAPSEVITAAKKALNSYLPNIDLTNSLWSTFPINRIEGKSKTDSWMPDTPTIHNTKQALYCWPTKLTFAPMLGDMIYNILAQEGIAPSHKTTIFDALPKAKYTKTPWDTAQWTK